MLFKIQRLNESSAIWRNWCLGFLKDVSLSVTQGLLVSKMSQQAFCRKISQVCSLAGAPTLHLSLRHRGVLQDHLQEQVMSSHHLRQVFSFDDLGLGEIFVALKRSKYWPQSYRPSLAQHSPYQAGLLPLFWTAASHCSLPSLRSRWTSRSTLSPEKSKSLNIFLLSCWRLTFRSPSSVDTCLLSERSVLFPTERY